MMAAFFKFKIFNPSEDEINSSSFIKFSLFMFRLVSFVFEPLSGSANWKQRFTYKAKFIYVKVVLLALAVGNMSMVAFAVINSDNFMTATSAVPNIVTVLLIELKAIATYIHKDDIWNIFEELREVFDRRATVVTKYKIKGYLDNYHFIIKIYSATFVIVFLPIAFPMFPFLMYGTMELTVNYWFPFDAFKVSNFPFALIWVDWVAWNCLVLLLGTESLLYGLIAVITMEFDILRIDFLNLQLAPEQERAKIISNLSDHHNKLLSICDKLQVIYALSILFSFAISSLIMCFIAFQLSTTEFDFVAYSFYVPYLGMVGGQIMLLCFFGQKLIDSSQAVADGVYNCGWENFDNKKQFILIILRSQKAKRLTAMGFADLSLVSFTSVGSST